MKIHFDCRKREDTNTDNQTLCGIDISRNWRSMRYRQALLQLSRNMDEVTCIRCRPSLKDDMPDVPKIDRTPKLHWRHPFTKKAACRGNNRGGGYYATSTDEKDKVTCTRCLARLVK